MSDCVSMQQQDKHRAAAMPPSFTRTLGFPPLPTPLSPSSSTIQHHPSDCNSGSLRRTMSADMSSDRWKAHSGIKKTPSVENLQAIDDVWSSILTGKADDTDKAALPPPYVHPLVKRSSSTLSEKSLLVCTESLGSETGSDGFSLELCESEQEEKVEEEEQNAQPEVEVVAEKDHVKVVEEEPRVAAAACDHLATVKKVAQRPFPPPLPSLAHRGDGSNLHMRSHRSDGRLVLEAVSVPSLNCFRAERQDGRLLLTFSDTDETESNEEADVTEDEQEELESDLDSESECEGEEREMGPIFGESELLIPNYAPKFLCLARENTSPWPHRLNKVVANLDGNNNHPITSLILNSKYPKDSAIEILNQYEYSWRGVAEIVPTMSSEERGMNTVVRRRPKKSAEREEVTKVEDKRAAQVEYQVPNSLRGCNQRRRMRSPLQLEPRCIAT